MLSLATLFCVSPPGGTLLPGTEPTVDTVPVQPIPAYWYYVMAAGGAVLVLVSVALALVLHYHRFRYAAKKTDHSITYKTSHYTNGAPLAVEPTLTIKLEQDRSSHCWGPKQGQHPKQTRKTANTLPRFCTFFSSPSLCVNSQTCLSWGRKPCALLSIPTILLVFFFFFSPLFCWFQTNQPQL